MKIEVADKNKKICAGNVVTLYQHPVWYAFYIDVDSIWLGVAAACLVPVCTNKIYSVCLRNTNEWNLFSLKGVVTKAGQWWVWASQWSDKMCVLFDVERELVRLISNSCCSERWRWCSLDVSWIDEMLIWIQRKHSCNSNVFAFKTVFKVSWANRSLFHYFSGQPSETAVVHQLFSAWLAFSNEFSLSETWMNRFEQQKASCKKKTKLDFTSIPIFGRGWRPTPKILSSLLLLDSCGRDGDLPRRKCWLVTEHKGSLVVWQPIESQRWLEACNTLFIRIKHSRSIPRLCWRFIKMTNIRTEQRLK